MGLPVLLMFAASVRNVFCMKPGRGTLAVADVRLKALGAPRRYLEVRVGRVPPQMSRSISAGRRFNEGHQLFALLVGAVVGLVCAYCAGCIVRILEEWSIIFSGCGC